MSFWDTPLNAVLALAWLCVMLRALPHISLRSLNKFLGASLCTRLYEALSMQR